MRAELPPTHSLKNYKNKSHYVTTHAIQPLINPRSPNSRNTKARAVAASDKGFQCFTAARGERSEHSERSERSERSKRLEQTSDTNGSINTLFISCLCFNVVGMFGSGSMCSLVVLFTWRSIFLLHCF